MLGLQHVRFAVPFVPSFAPGCVWRVEPAASLWISTTVLGQGATAMLADLTSAPMPTTVQAQALVTGLAQGWREHAAPDPWEIGER